jgi:predicted ribosomally synthesized peptide with nif11-like leader
MAIDSAEALVAKLQSDESLRAEFKKATSEEAFMEIAKKMGYNTNLDEFRKAVAKKYHPAAGELSDDDLDKAAGGLSIVGVDYAFTAIQTASS